MRKLAKFLFCIDVLVCFVLSMCIDSFSFETLVKLLPLFIATLPLGFFSGVLKHE